MHEHARPSRSANRKRLAAVLALTVALLVVEAAAGFLTRSLALLADATHMLADVGALTLALVAMRFAERPATPQKTFGFYRVEILAACVNSAALTVLAGLILVAAWDRLRTPAPVKAVPMLIVAAVALAVNVGSMLLLRRGADSSLNVKGAYLEVFSDALMSLGVLAAGVTISLTGLVRGGCARFGRDRPVHSAANVAAAQGGGRDPSGRHPVAGQPRGAARRLACHSGSPGRP